MTEPKISVIVPVYKVEPYLRKCVDSIIAQTYHNLEIILVDDGSPDTCGTICDEYAAKDKRVKVIHKLNGGPGDARNVGLDIATGDCIGFVDSDDYLEPTMYEEMMQMMQENDLDTVICSANIIENGKIVQIRSRYYSENTILQPEDVLKASLTDTIEAYFPFKLFRSHCWEHVRFPANRIFEDVAISFRPYVNAKKPVGYLDKPLYNYIKNEKGLTYHRKSISIYHLFLANLEHYQYAKDHCREVLPQCAALTARFALGTYIDYACCGYQELAPYVSEVEQFLQDNRSLLKNDHYMQKAWRIGLKLYYFSKPLFNVVYKQYMKLR